jgi:predicted phage terminase large subunit-like protein
VTLAAALALGLLWLAIGDHLAVALAALLFVSAVVATPAPGRARRASQASIDRDQIRRKGLAEFVRRAWPIVEPSQALEWSWHLDAICEQLERVTRGEIRRLVINVPPGCSKSLIVSVLWPAWVWTQKPGHRWMCASHGDMVVTRDAERMRSLIKSAWYRERWPDVQIPEGKAASDAARTFRTTRGGMRYSQTVRGQWTGEHCDTLIVDDPIDPDGAEATSGVELDDVIAWWDGTMPSRFRDHKRSATVLIMQRLHARDLAGYILAEEPDAVVLCLPMQFEQAHPHRWPGDPRTEEGELLVPERIPLAAVVAMTKRMKWRAPAQLQQRPTGKEGEIFKEAYFKRRWTELPAGGTFTLSVDCKFASKETRSAVVIQCWYQKGPDHYLVDQIRGHFGFVDTCKQLVVMATRYPKALRKLVEAKANGPAVVDALKGEFAGFIEVEPEGSKEARAWATEPLWESGNVWLPHPTEARYPDGTKRAAGWVDEEPEGFVREHLTFPRGLFDDQVDAGTQYLRRYARNTAETWKSAWGKVREQMLKGTGT